MALRTWMTTLALATAIAAPAGAQQHERRRPHNTDSNQPQQTEPAGQPRQRAAEQAAAPQDRAVPRAEARQGQQVRQDEARRQAADERARQDQVRRQPPVQTQPRNDVAVQRRADNSRAYDNRAYAGNRRWDNRRYESYVTGSHRYNAYVYRPQVVRVVPYRPYVYRPSYNVGVYYGDGGYYPYGYTPRGYFEPIPGRAYGGVRITGAPRDAQVFADGYYVGIVNDFDGIFQHINLEAGPHHIEIAWGGYQPMAFDIYVRPGETTTFRADGYFRY